MFCSAIVVFNTTSGFTLRSAIPVYGKATSGLQPFVVAGGITTGYLERENVPKHIVIHLLPVTSAFQTSTVPASQSQTWGWDQTYTKTQKATLCESICT